MVKISYIKGIIMAILVGVGGWALFTLIRLLIQKLLSSIGINSEILQVFIILVLVIILLFTLGFTFKKSLKKLL